MTVIATVMSRWCTAHATDSFITERQPDGKVTLREDQQTKIVRVPRFDGAMSYWGLAAWGAWSTLTFLRERAQRARDFNSAEAFAEDMNRRLRDAISSMPSP